MIDSARTRLKVFVLMLIVATLSFGLAYAIREQNIRKIAALKLQSQK